jgi:hypothetical protein
MDERLKNKIEKSADQKDPGYYLKNVEKLISPFIVGAKTEDPYEIADSIAYVLDGKDDEILFVLRESYILTSAYVHAIKEVRTRIKDRTISKNAPWFKKLEEKMLRFELYAANISQKELEQANEDSKKKIRDVFKEIGIDLDKNSPDKK